MRHFNALLKSGSIQNFQWIYLGVNASMYTLRTVSVFWEFWENHSKSRLQFGHVPVHRRHSAKVTTMPTTGLGADLARIVRILPSVLGSGKGFWVEDKSSEVKGLGLKVWVFRV